MLDLACFSGHTECVETLLLQGATILVHDNISRRTPLHAAGNYQVFEPYRAYFIKVYSFYKVIAAQVAERLMFCSLTTVARVQFPDIGISDGL